MWGGDTIIKPRGTYILIAYGPLLILSFYATWLAGRVSLGYWPQSSIDDPKFIEGFWMWIYFIPWILHVVGFPLALMVGAASVSISILEDSPEWKTRLIEVIVGIGVLVLTFTFIAWDPHKVVEWYLD